MPARHRCGMRIAGGMNAAPTVRARSRAPATTPSSRPSFPGPRVSTPPTRAPAPPRRAHHRARSVPVPVPGAIASRLPLVPSKQTRSVDGRGTRAVPPTAGGMNAARTALAPPGRGMRIRCTPRNGLPTWPEAAPDVAYPVSGHDRAGRSGAGESAPHARGLCLPAGGTPAGGEAGAGPAQPVRPRGAARALEHGPERDHRERQLARRRAARRGDPPHPELRGGSVPLPPPGPRPTHRGRLRRPGPRRPGARAPPGTRVDHARATGGGRTTAGDRAPLGCEELPARDGRGADVRDPRPDGRRPATRRHHVTARRDRVSPGGVALPSVAGGWPRGLTLPGAAAHGSRASSGASSGASSAASPGAAYRAAMPPGGAPVAATAAVAATRSTPEALSREPSRRSSGQCQATSPTTTRVPIAPETTDTTGPNAPATAPDSKPPS